MYFIRRTLLLFLLIVCKTVYCQQDIELYVTNHYLTGQKTLKVYKNIASPIIWVLATNNKVYKINTLSNLVDDYSNQFATYNTFQFIDVVSPDDQTLIVATNASSVLILKNGTIQVLGLADGLVGNVNSIGLFLKSSYFYYGNDNILRIGTDKGWADFDIDTDQLTFFPDTQPGLIFDLNYRAGMDEESSGQPSTNPDIVPIAINTSSIVPPLTVFRGYIWQNGIYGQPTTAYYSLPTLFLDAGSDYYFVYLFWGSDKGLFENRLVAANSQSEIKQYLNGIKVNKINNILGLTNFGSTYFKNNLLIGTGTGLYFSNSTVNTSVVPPNLTLTHLDQLGNIPVNDIQTSIASISSTNPLIDCEDGAWLATDNGVYFVKPDYTKFSPAAIHAVSFNNQPTNVDTLQVCAVNNIDAVIDSTVVNGNSIQWFKDGQSLSNEIGLHLNITAPGDYKAVLYDPCANIHIETNHLYVSLNPAPTFTFNYPSELKYCDGTLATLNVQGKTGYHYRWFKDNVLIGDTTNTVTFTQAGKYHIEVSICPDNWVSSKEVQVDFINLPVPTITTNKPAYCIGDVAILSINIPVDTNYTISWFRDGQLVDYYQGLTKITANTAGSYVVTVSSKLVGNCIQAASPIQLVFNPPPTVSLQQIVNTTLCEGQTITLKANYTGGNIKWSTGETTDVINVTASGIYKAEVTSSAGCITDSSIYLQLLPNPIFTVNDTSICTYKNQAITLTAPSGFSQYEWDGQVGGQTYQVTEPKSVSLTVTDINGCQATHKIKVVDQCPNILIPNTFTPNGDGINDTWVIEGLENDQTVLIRVFNRYGTQVYQSKGYGNAWNGYCGGKKLPSGVYYYILTAKNGTQKFSGSLTILY